MMETDEDLIGDIIFINPIEMMMSESYEEWKLKYQIPFDEKERKEWKKGIF